MHLTDLKSHLAMAGYREHQYNLESTLVAFFQKRVDADGPGCLSNDDKVFINIYIHELYMNGVNHRSVELEIAGEYREGCWIKHRIYGIGWDAVAKVGALELFESDLLTAWFATCKAAGR